MSDLHLTTPNMHGSRVQVLQKALAARGWYHGMIDSQFGVLTAQAVYRAKFYLGYPRPDHSAGDLLLEYLRGKKVPPTFRLLARKRRPKPVVITSGVLLLREATKYVGITESPPGSNRNPFGVWYGANGVPWCAEFVSFCGAQVGLKSFKQRTRYAYVPYMVADIRAAANHWTLAHTSNVLPGDAVCYDWNGDGTADHVGIFDHWVDKGKSFAAVEGNTGSTDRSNGGQVLKTVRLVGEVQVFGRPH